MMLLSSSALADTPEVDVESHHNGKSEIGADLEISVTVTDGNGLLAFVGVAGTTRTINSVKSYNSQGIAGPVFKADFTKVGEIDFAPGTAHTVAWIGVLDNQMRVNMVYDLMTYPRTGAKTLDHGVDNVFVLEPNARVVACTMWNEGDGTVNFSATGHDEHWPWKHSNGVEGFYVFSDHPGIPIEATTESEIDMECISGVTNPQGPDPVCKSINVAVVIRSSSIIDTTHGTPGTLDPTTGKWWSEGINRNRSAQHAGDEWELSNDYTPPPQDDPGSYDAARNEITDAGGPGWGSHIKDGMVAYIPNWVAEGQGGSDIYRMLTAKPSHDLDTDNYEINILAFSPRNPDREEIWDKYIFGLKPMLDGLIVPGGMWEHLGVGGNDWGDLHRPRGLGSGTLRTPLRRNAG